MPISVINKTLHSTNRKDIRNEVINWFLKENCGTGKGEKTSKYFYIVEEYQNKKIILKRPAPLNKGFDFEVSIESLYFKSAKRKHNRPAHNDIVCALKKAKNTNEQVYNSSIKFVLNEIYKCNSINLSGNSMLTFIDDFNCSVPIEIILLAIKWLFIEQDITYWNRSGREMLFNSLKENHLV